MKNKRLAAVVCIVGLIIFNFWMIVTDAQPWVISSLNILFHEAGHLIFSLFGDFVGVLGGTLGELLMPGVFIRYFWIKKDVPGQAFSLWWLSTSLYHISIYVSDARTQQLELIGGPGGHDWFYILGRLRLLEFDIFIGRVFVFFATVVTFFVALLCYRYWQLRLEKPVT
jgi:hypothetical protein